MIKGKLYRNEDILDDFYKISRINSFPDHTIKDSNLASVIGFIWDLGQYKECNNIGYIRTVQNEILKYTGIIDEKGILLELHV